MNYLWSDGETTGLNPVEHDIIQWASIPIINGVRQKTFNEFCQPNRWDNIEQGAIDVHGITVDQMKTFQSSADCLDKFIDYIRSFGVKFVIAGYNISFDKRFLSSWFAKHGRAEDFKELFEVHVHDTFKRWKNCKEAPKLENNKLETVANHYNIEIKAHDALSDIEATIEVDKILSGLLGEEDYEYVADVDINEIEVSSQFLPMPQLHVHSQYSLGMAVPKPEEWMRWCEQNNSPAFSCVDHGSGISLYDARLLKSDKVTMVPGLGVYVKFQDEKEYGNVNIWATNNDGYKNLLKLASLGYQTPIEVDGNTVPMLTYDQLLENRDGLKFGIGGADSIFARHLLNNNAPAAEAAYQYFIEKFGDDIYFEVCPIDIVRIFEGKFGFRKINRSDCIPEANLGKAMNQFIVNCHNKFGGKLIPTTGAFFIRPNDKILQDTLMKNHSKSGHYFYESYHVKNEEETYKTLKVHLKDDINEDVFNSWIKNCYEIIEPAKNIKIDFEYHMPEIEIPQHIKDYAPGDYDKQTYLYLVELCKTHGRWSDRPEYIERFKQEIDVIKNNAAMNFIPYFLLYEDLGRFAREQGFLQNIARGSAGGCLISYYLKIIHVDPIEADLPFERFLSHARINANSWPDIDMDISRKARPYVMKYLKEKYGLGFAQIATLSTMKTKNAIKDTMAALYERNRNDPEVKAVCDTIPDSPQGVNEEKFLYGYEDNEGNYHEGHLETNTQLQIFFKRYPDVSSIVKRLIGIVRGWSRHASAFVISTVNLPETRCPTMKMWDNHMGDYIQVTQYDAGMVEGSGLVKADILGLKTLDMVTDCVHLIRKNTGKDYLDEAGFKGVPLVYRLPDDTGVYNDFYNKATDSSFQFNTSLIKGFIQEFAPNARNHLKDMTALCRPGALDAEWEPGISAAQFYLDVRNNARQVQYVHDDLEPILGSTNGVFVYQEQVMKFLVDFGGHTLEESDRVRGAIAKKKRDVMQSSFDRVRQRTAELGWTSEQTEKVCQQIEAFARYSFNLSHSHAYAELGYITMYLKHHHKLEWWVAVLNNENDEDKLRHYISILGDLITPPSMSQPSNKFQIKDGKIAAPISVIKRVGEKSVKELVEKGPFSSIDDYIERVNHTKANIGVVGQMIMARAADDLMDQNLPYPDARLKFMQDFVTKRKTNSKFKDELKSMDPLSIFLLEREANKAFNKAVLEDPGIVDIIRNKWKSLIPTDKKQMPFITIDNLLVLANARIAQALVKKGVDKYKKFAFILLFQGSKTKSGISKKGNEYNMCKISLSDGYNDIEAVKWDMKEALRFPKNSLVYVEGTLKEGWRTPVSITVDEIEKIL